MRALLITSDPALQADIASQGAARIPPLSVLAVRASLRDALERPLADALDLVILDASDPASEEGDQLERLRKHYGVAAFMLLLSEQRQAFLIRAMRAGVREVLPLPLVHRAFHEALDRLAAVAGHARQRDGKVLALIACKGGSGATFIATNLGHALATLAGKRVLLVDLHSQFGDAALYVSDQKPQMSLADVCAQAERVDAAFLASCLLHVAPDFGILAAADEPGRGAPPKPEHIDLILRVARQHYDFILLDIGRNIDAVSLRALDCADTIYPVLQLSLPDIRDGRRLVDMFRSLGYVPAQVRLLVNRYEKGGKLRLADVQTALGAEVLHTIPNDYVAVTDSVNQGVPVLQLARQSAVARSLSALAARLADCPLPDERGLLDRLFSKE